MSVRPDFNTLADNQEAHMFPGYVLRYSTEADIEEITAIIEADHLQNTSKKEAVYPRDPHWVAWAARSGLYAIISREAQTTEEFEALGKQHRRIVALAGAYRLGIDVNGNQVPFGVERTGGREVVRHVVEIGSARYLKEEDLPNKENRLPSGCFFKLLVGAVAAKVFHMAGSEIADKKLLVDTIVSNVQNRLPMLPTMQRIQEDPLGYRLLVPSSDLVKNTGSTTRGKSFARNRKNYFGLPVSSMPKIAKLLLDIKAKKRVASDVIGKPDVVGIKVEIEPDFELALNAIIRAQDSLFKRSTEQSSFAEYRALLEQYLPHPPTRRKGGKLTLGEPIEPLSLRA